MNAHVVPLNTTVSLSHLDRTTLEVKLAPDEQIRIPVTGRGKVRVSAECSSGDVMWSGVLEAAVQFELFANPASQVVLTIDAPGDDAIRFAKHFQIAGLKLMELDQLLSVADRAPRPVPGILSGVLYLESLNGRRLELRPYEQINASRWSGTVRRLGPQRTEYGEPAFRLQASATVEGLSLGVGHNARNMMPTWLQWLAERQGLALLWGATLSVAGVLITFVRWFGIAR